MERGDHRGRADTSADRTPLSNNILKVARQHIVAGKRLGRDSENKERRKPIVRISAPACVLSRLPIQFLSSSELPKKPPGNAGTDRSVGLQPATECDKLR